MTIQAKCKVQSVALSVHRNQRHLCVFVEIRPKTRRGLSTHLQGNLEMTITAEGAIGMFKPGHEFYLTFSENP